MRKLMVVIVALWMCLMLSACSFLKKPKADITFSIPSKQTFSAFDEVHHNKYVLDEIVEREDGFFEVFVNRTDKDTGERQKIRFLFTADGILIGERSSTEGGGQQDSIELLDCSFKTFLVDMEDSIDRIKDNRIYLTDGGYMDLELDGDRILRIENFSDEDIKIADIQFNEWGQAESVTYFDEKGEEYLSVRTTYETINLDGE